MNASLVCDDNRTTARVQAILREYGLDCPESRVYGFGHARGRLAQEAESLIVVVLPREPENALEALDLLEHLPANAGNRALAVGPTANSRVVIRALRGIVDDYLDEDDLEGELGAALNRLQKTGVVPGMRGRIISVLSPSGGGGASTVATNVAACLAKEFKTAALLDLDLLAGDQADLLDLKPIYTLADLCQNLDRMDLSLFDRSLSRHPGGVALVAAPRDMSDASCVTAEGVGKVLALARSAFPFVVADLDRSFGEGPLLVLHHSDAILLPFVLDFSALRHVRRTLEHLTRHGVPRERIQLVVNRVGRPREVPIAKAEEALGGKVNACLPDDPKAVNRANNTGVPVVLGAPSSRISKALARLAVSINGVAAKR